MTTLTRYFADYDSKGNCYYVPLDDAEDWYTQKSFLGDNFGPDTVPDYAIRIELEKVTP